MTATADTSGKYRYPHHVENAPTVRLAHVHSAQGSNLLMGKNGVAAMSLEDALPALLVSFYYLKPFEKYRDRYVFRDWVMDSGAFSAKSSGVTIDLDEYIEKSRELIATDPKLVEVFALDVIGDHRASLRNAERMWEEGIPAIPTFHVGSPWSALIDLAKRFPKIALGGAVRYKKKEAWASQCFARVWPKRIHGFGFGSESSIMGLPWHSTDATNWEMKPCAYGRWNAFGGKMSIRGSRQNLRAEVEWYLELERRARSRWKKEMELLDEVGGGTLRLSVASHTSRTFKGISRDKGERDEDRPDV